MNKLYYLIVLVFVFYDSSGQTEGLFDISVKMEDSSHEKTSKDFKSVNSIFYEDDDYLVTKTCSGEWGGTIWFKNKKTGIIYVCGSTCPISVYKLDGRYIVTNTLAHMHGSTDVIAISNPDSLEVYKPYKPKKKHGVIIRIVGDDESASTKGSIQLLDTSGIIATISFPYKGQLFLIINDYKKTFLAKLENKMLIPIETITDARIWSYEREVIKTSDNHYVAFFSNSEVRGYFDIYENKITLIRYK